MRSGLTEVVSTTSTIKTALDRIFSFSVMKKVDKATKYSLFDALGMFLTAAPLYQSPNLTQI
jgi:hypothetical protein